MPIYCVACVLLNGKLLMYIKERKGEEEGEGEGKRMRERERERERKMLRCYSVNNLRNIILKGKIYLLCFKIMLFEEAYIIFF